MISCRKFIQLSISFRSVRVSTGGSEEGGHRLQLNHNDFVFNLHFFDVEAMYPCLCVCICGRGTKRAGGKKMVFNFI